MISIIIPVYNVAAYLERCLQSVIAQEYPDFECILVDDGSTDGSSSICDRYAVANPHFKVIHQPNAGVSAARNRGIDAANGEWLYFIDGDDWMERDIFDYIDWADTEVDMIVGCYRREGGGISFEERHKVSQTSNPALSYLKEELRIAMGTFAIRRGLTTTFSLRFPERYRFGEDMDFVLRCLLLARCVSVDIRVWMTYRLNPKSAMSQPTIQRYNVVSSRLALVAFAKNCGNVPVSDFLSHYSIAEAIFTISRSLAENALPIKEFKSYLRDDDLLAGQMRLIIDDVNHPSCYRAQIVRLYHWPTIFYCRWRVLAIYYKSRQIIGQIRRRFFKI